MVRRQPLSEIPQRPDNEGRPRFVDRLSLKYKHPPVRFKIEPAPQHCNGQGQLVCAPGSFIQGRVLVQLSEPLAAIHLKLVFKASESVNYDAMDCGKRLSEDKLFNVHTILWGTRSRTSDSWPVMEPGYHFFPFTCEMPDVNYPSAYINNNFTRCRFVLYATLERPGHRPFMTLLHPVYFQPRVLVPSLLPFDETKHIDSTTTVQVRLRRAYATSHDDAITVAFRCNGFKHHYAMTGTIALEQHYSITAGKFQNQRTVVVRETDNRRIAESGDETQLSVPLARLPPTTDYGRQIDLSYFVRIDVKSRQSALHPAKKRCSFLIPVIIGSDPQDECTSLSTGILAYTDSSVMLDRTLRIEPQFLQLSGPNRPNMTMPLLPPYDPDNRPPVYIEQEHQKAIPLSPSPT
ncbi:hypothetical protein BX666DRAFT_2022370 [Dichotomocladium elegans]|nr:hypothetical protein BX666DRAFT_2022370 [Dichotomocladium elegans]